MRIAHALIAVLVAMPCLPVQATTGRGPGGSAIANDGEGQEIVSDWEDANSQARNEAKLASAMLALHNDARRAAGIAPLRWDADLARGAASHAATLAGRHRMAHSVRLESAPVEGENLWMGTRNAYSYAEMAGSWIDERTAFRVGRFPDLSRTGSWSDVGHYTQVIWADTQTVGCALASDARDDYLVCRYFPAGNVWGESPFGAPVRTASTSFENASAR